MLPLKLLTFLLHLLVGALALAVQSLEVRSRALLGLALRLLEAHLGELAEAICALAPLLEGGSRSEAPLTELALSCGECRLGLPRSLLSAALLVGAAPRLPLQSLLLEEAAPFRLSRGLLLQVGVAALLERAVCCSDLAPRSASLVQLRPALLLTTAVAALHERDLFLELLRTGEQLPGRSQAARRCRGGTASCSANGTMAG
mmetsp:Transcript_14065/g.29442  ORF Transcript_14065/g.29442 Transcript_14065/m.29442 type:complete len:202 (-) Transcript_14065:18-623(-)